MIIETMPNSHHYEIGISNPIPLPLRITTQNTTRITPIKILTNQRLNLTLTLKPTKNTIVPKRLLKQPIRLVNLQTPNPPTEKPGVLLKQTGGNDNANI